MIGILLPEVVIYNSLESIISLLRKDIKYHVEDETKTILYKILGVDEKGDKIQMNFYNFFKQAKKIFLQQDNLSVNFGYNSNVAKNLALHIILPSEQGESTIGLDEGYINENIYDEDNEKVSVQEYYTQLYDTNYQIMITGNNSSEVNLIYNILKSMLLMVYVKLELSGLRNLKFSGNDIVMQDDLSPVPIFHKVINMSFKYELNIPKFLTNEVMKRFIIEMKAMSEEEFIKGSTQL